LIYLAMMLVVITAVVVSAWFAFRSGHRRLVLALSGLALAASIIYIAVIVDAYPRNVARGRQEMTLISRQLIGKSRGEAYAILRQRGLAAYSLAYRVFRGDGFWPEPIKDYNGAIVYPDVTVKYTLGDELLCAEYGGQEISFVHERVVKVVSSEFHRCFP
jgi:hypothetical protein